MDFAYIKDRVKNEVADDVDSKLLAGWIDDLVVIISKSYGTVVKWELEDIEKGDETNLPDNYMETAEVFDSDGKRFTSYIITAYGQIIFLEDGDYTVLYYSLPEPMDRDGEGEVGNATEPEVHKVFHPDIITGCKAKYWDWESEGDRQESGHANKFWTAFYQSIYESARLLRKREHMPKHMQVGDPWLFGLGGG